MAKRLREEASSPIFIRFLKTTKSQVQCPKIKSLSFQDYLNCSQVEQIKHNSIDILNACLVAASKAPKGCLGMSLETLQAVKDLKRNTLEVLAANGHYSLETVEDLVAQLKSLGVPVHLRPPTQNYSATNNRTQMLEEYSDYMDFQVHQTMELRRAIRNSFQ